mmetsp:Transcript_81396/g.143692  ORF Transcript_81396/g.143692 Transcript_81396/m.143692 type:complete len:530 (-) Transcript_81396:177-1766(-)
MGQHPSKAVTSAVVERHGGSAFRVGFAEMNGWRGSMEDAHVIYAKDTWGFFGIFDGHGGDQCSAYIAKRVTEELDKNGAPPNDQAVTDLALKLDQEFLDSRQSSGSTGTFIIVNVPTNPGGDYNLRVANIGDSRILLGRADGTIFPGPGTDQGLTTDHKPSLDSERERIERTGGNVQYSMGVARVNGDLAVSRAFGDSQHKMTGGPAQKDHPVVAVPELVELQCRPTDFLMLVCDGISEGSFPNEQVVSFAAERLKPLPDGRPIDLAKVAMEVCHKAIQEGSKDNLSCVIVLLGGGEVPGKSADFIPGPFYVNGNASFQKAYSEMAQRADMKKHEAVERRYSLVQQGIETLEAGNVFDELAGEGCDLTDLKTEMDQFDEGPPPENLPGSAERVAWFEKWLDAKLQSGGDGAQEEAFMAEQAQQQALQQLLQSNPEVMQQLVQSNQRVQAIRRVRVAPESLLKPAMEDHAALKWDDRLKDACEMVGEVLQDDASDGTSQVKFHGTSQDKPGFKAWLPTEQLSTLEDGQNS